MLIKIDNQHQSLILQLLVENNIECEKLDEGNYVSECPNCGDDEFWHNGHCGHCGYNL